MSNDQAPRTVKDGSRRVPLCPEPWKNYYILRRGILPCCHGHAVLAPMTAWPTAWNSEAMQEIRSYLARGELSPYCLRSLSCPIVQQHLGEERIRLLVTASLPEAPPPPSPPPPPPAILRAVNRLLLGLPGRIYRRVAGSVSR